MNSRFPDSYNIYNKSAKGAGREALLYVSAYM